MKQTSQSVLNYSVDDSKPKAQRDEERLLEDFVEEAQECAVEVKQVVDSVLTEHSAFLLIVEDRRYERSFTFWEEAETMSTHVLEKLHRDISAILDQRQKQQEINN